MPAITCLQLEFQIQDRISFRPVLALSLDDTRPEAKTICLFRPQLTPAGLSEKLFQPWDQFRPQNGFAAPKGQMVDARVVAVPRQPNSREEINPSRMGSIISVIRIRLRLMLSTN
ncbi:hypothetical protein CMK14_15750 [Candidatus Poribacteria bacterium]|nr:hypothetical protein [Candidatus Poribacteria bacterium]